MKTPASRYVISSALLMLPFSDISLVTQSFSNQWNQAQNYTYAQQNISPHYNINPNSSQTINPINTFFIYNPKNDEINETSFLQDAPSSFSSSAIYLLEVDEDHGFIYVGTSDYTNSGTIYQFNRNGKLIQSFDSGGINPSTMIFFG